MSINIIIIPSVSGLPAPGRDRHPEAGGEDEVREPGGGAGGLLSCSDPRPNQTKPNQTGGGAGGLLSCSDPRQ